MRRFKHFRLALLVVMLLTVSGLPPQVVIAQGSKDVAVNASAHVPVDSTFVATIVIWEVLDLNAAQYDITFDNKVLELTDITEGRIGGKSIPITYNNIGKGTYRVINSMELGTAVGSGTLATLKFQAIGDVGESSNIDLSNGILSGLTTGQIPADWTGDSVELFLPPTQSSTSVYPVGGDVYPTNKTAIVARWIALA
ncbi:cohesin domain-containing protein, partial [Chloroflexota bacterium]